MLLCYVNPGKDSEVVRWRERAESSHGLLTLLLALALEGMMHFGTSESGIAQLNSAPLLLLLLELSNVTGREREGEGGRGGTAARRASGEEGAWASGRKQTKLKEGRKGGWWYKRPALIHCACVHGAFESWAIMQRTSWKLCPLRDVSYEAMRVIGYK